MNKELVKREALRYLGYRGQELGEDLESRLDTLLQTLEQCCTPRKIIAYYKPQFSENCVTLEGTGVNLTGSDICNHLAGASGVGVLLCTLGAGFDSTLVRLEAQSMADAVVFNALGSAYVEIVAEDCEREITSVASEKGLYTNYRFSPGYGDLPISTSVSLIDTTSASKRIGLTITADSILLPRKSVTAVVGLFEKQVSTADSEPCKICSLKENCVRRKEGNYCGRRK